MNATEGVKDSLNVKKNVSNNPVKRTLAKLRHPMRAQVSDSAAEKTFDESTDPGEEAHITTGEYASSAGHAVIKEITLYFQGPEGEAALKTILTCQARVVYDTVLEFLQSNELQATSRMAGREIVSGTSEGLEKKLSSQLEKLPKVITVSILPVTAIFLGLFVLGLLLALWRFALFGLHH